LRFASFAFIRFLLLIQCLPAWNEKSKVFDKYLRAASKVTPR
jgi:hypothetical protein